MSLYLHCWCYHNQRSLNVLSGLGVFRELFFCLFVWGPTRAPPSGSMRHIWSDPFSLMPNANIAIMHSGSRSLDRSDGLHWASWRVLQSWPRKSIAVIRGRPLSRKALGGSGGRRLGEGHRSGNEISNRFKRGLEKPSRMCCRSGPAHLRVLKRFLSLMEHVQDKPSLGSTETLLQSHSSMWTLDNCTCKQSQYTTWLTGDHWALTEE